MEIGDTLPTGKLTRVDGTRFALARSRPILAIGFTAMLATFPHKPATLPCLNRTLKRICRLHCLA